jgi:hypothetical protein
MDLDGLQPFSLGRGAWRPSIGGGTLVYYENGLKARDLESGQVREIDAQGTTPARPLPSPPTSAQQTAVATSWSPAVSPVDTSRFWGRRQNHRGCHPTSPPRPTTCLHSAGCCQAVRMARTLRAVPLRRPGEPRHASGTLGMRL